MEPLSVRLLDFIRRNPGNKGDRVISGVLDFRREKESDAQRILIVLENTGKVYTCELYDPEIQKFVPYYYSMDALPIQKEGCRCLRTVLAASSASPTIRWMSSMAAAA